MGIVDITESFPDGDGHSLIVEAEDGVLRMFTETWTEYTADSDVRYIDDLIETLQTAREQIWGEKE